MSSNDLIGICHVEETSDLREVNANLANGWKLLLVYTYASSDTLPNDLTSVYSLGWPSGQGEPNFISFERPRNGWC